MARPPEEWMKEFEQYVFYDDVLIRDHFKLFEEKDGTWSIYKADKAEGIIGVGVKVGSKPIKAGFDTYGQCQSYYSYLCKVANEYVAQKSGAKNSSKTPQSVQNKKIKKTSPPKSGWLMSLSHSPDEDPDSQWGDVVSFFEEMEAAPVKNGKYIVDGWLWGRIGKKGATLEKGDPIAFYHSTSARFRPRDPHKRKSRISLVGELVDVKETGHREWDVTIAIDKKVLKYMKDHPIVRDGDLVKLFETCGIKQGNVAAFYYAPPEAWQKIIAMTRP